MSEEITGQTPDSVTEESQPSQEASQAQESVNSADAQQNVSEAAKTVSVLEYNKAREAERKLRSEVSRLNKMAESSREAIALYETLSKSGPDKIKKIIGILQDQQQAEQNKQPEDDSWLNDLDERVANRFREQRRLQDLVEKDLASRLNSLEQEILKNKSWTVGQNEKILENTFYDFLKSSKIFPEINEEIEQTPKFQMIQNHVLAQLSNKYQDPRLATPEDLKKVLNEVKEGLSDISKQELNQKVQPSIPPSGSKTGQIPPNKVTQEDVTSFWSSFRDGMGL